MGAAPGDASQEFISEGTIDHTSKEHEVFIKMGSTIDVVGEVTIRYTVHYTW